MSAYHTIIQEMTLNWRVPAHAQRWTVTPPQVCSLLQAFTLFPFKKTKPTLKKFFENPTDPGYEYVPVYMSNLTQEYSDMIFDAKCSETFYTDDVSPYLRTTMLHAIKFYNQKYKSEINREIPMHLTPFAKKRTQINVKDLRDWQLVNIIILIYGVELEFLTDRIEKFLTKCQESSIPRDVKSLMPPRTEEPPDEDALQEIGFVKAEEVCPLCKEPYSGKMLTSSVCKHPGSMHEQCFHQYENYRFKQRKELQCPFNGCNLNLSRIYLKANQAAPQYEIIHDLSQECIVLD